MSSITPAQAAQQSNRDHLGRYQEQQRSEAETNILMNDEDTFKNGSFHFPPKFTTAEQAIDFYSRIPVDDEIVARAYLASKQVYEAAVQEIEARKQESIEVRVKEFMADWDSKPENKGGLFRENPARAQAEHDERDRLAQLPYSEFGLDEPQPNFRTFDAQEIVRSIKMCNYRPSPERFPEESEKVQNHVVHLDEGDLTVQQIVDRYAIPKVKDQLGYNLPKDNNSEELLAEMRAVREEINTVRQENANLQGALNQLRDEHNNAATLREIDAGYRDRRGNWIGPGRHMARKITGR